MFITGEGAWKLLNEHLKACGVGTFTEGDKTWKVKKMVEVLDQIWDPMKLPFASDPNIL